MPEDRFTIYSFSWLGRTKSLLTLKNCIIYLKTCLSGDASRLITNLTVSEDDFPIAWASLVSRYENKRVLNSSQLDTLFNIKHIKAKSAKELNTMLTTVIESLGALQALGCHINS